jgi:acyl-CoA synthetase (AMP-forming)/AMP-acid ligase II
VSAPGPLWDLLSLPGSLDPSRPILSSGEEALDFAAAEQRAVEIAARLDGSPVALLDTNSQLALLLMYACFRSGSRFVPLNYRLRPQELADILCRGGVSTLVHGSRYADVAAEAAAGWDGRMFEIGRLCGRGEPGGDAAAAAADGAGDIVLFTSGTSSAPKPIPLDSAPLAAWVMATTPLCPPQTREESLLMSMPLYHVAGIVAVLRSVFSGRRIAVLEQFEPTAWVEAVLRHRITHAFLVPTMMQRVLEAEPDRVGELTSLRTITYGGGPMPRTTIAAALEAFPRSVGFVGVYGLTEASGTVCVLDEADHDAARHGQPESAARLASVGRPVDDVTVTIESDEGGRPGPGDVGEIVIRGTRLTSALGGGARELRTGDLGFLDEDGYLHFRGRADDMIVRGGENIAPKEIEEALRGSPRIADCAVLGLPDEEWGQSVAAALVPADPAAALDLEALRAELRARLASYKWPTRVLTLEELPTSPTGKVVKRELLALFGAPAPLS